MTDPMVSATWLAGELGAPDLRVLHCMVALRSGDDGGYSIRAGRAEWESGHIPGSWLIDVAAELSDPGSDLDLMAPSRERIAAVMSAAGVGDGCRIVLYDAQMNIWAARVWWILRTIGVEAAVLDGGLVGWAADRRPIEVGPSEPPIPGAFTPGAPLDSFEEQEAVLAAIDDTRTCLVDALEPDVFRGRRQDYDRPGHIPGATNIPFATLVDPVTHRYLPMEELANKCARAMASERVITYCGAGAAASSVALTLKRLGKHRVAVYDGSLIEWSKDPTLPMVTAPVDEEGR